MPQENQNLYAAFAAAWQGRENAPFLVTERDRSYSFRQADSESARMAAYLRAIGVRAGDRVSVQVKKSPRNLFLYLACLRAGFVYHPLNIGYKKAELEYFIGNAEPTVFVCDGESTASVSGIATAAGVSHVLTLNGDGSGSLAEGSTQTDPEDTIILSGCDDLAALLYSSGTTGVPKGIMLSHGNLLSNTATLVSAWGFTQNDRLLHALPIFHVHGLFVAIGCTLLSGASMRWLKGFEDNAVIRHLPECSVMMGVPTYYTRLLANGNFTADVSANMRLFVSGSAPLLAETFHEFEARTGQRILERYGMSETNMNTSNPLHGDRRPGTVGPPLPGVEARICSDAGEILGPDQVGNLQIRGPNVFTGYWRMPEKTAEEFTGDGFFNTGDLGRIDTDGYVEIVGRNKDLVITGGLNVYPKEVELFLDELDGVKESAVIGVPHADFGEGVVAVIVSDDSSQCDENEIIAACREHLADFKVPKRAVFVDALPRNTMAKVQKNELRQHYRRLLDKIGD